MIDYTLQELWDKYYRPDFLQRLDLSTEWRYVTSHKGMHISELIKKLNKKITEDSLVEIMFDIDNLFKKLDLLDEESRALMAFNILRIIEHHIKIGNSEIIRYISNRVNADTHNTFTRGMPQKVLVEVTNNCNLNCIMCGVGAGGYSSTRNMTMEMYSRVLSEIKGYAKEIRLNGLGEATIHPQFDRFIDMAYNMGLYIELITNLSSTSKKILDKLFKYNVTLYISCDSPNLKKLAKIRRKLNTEIFINNLHYIKENRKREQKIFIIFTIMDINYRDLPQMIQFAKKYSLDGVIGNMVKGEDNRWKTQKYDELIKVFDEAYEIARRENVLLKLPDQIEGKKIDRKYVSQSNHNMCLQYTEEAFIRYNGDVCPCNMMNPYIYGNINRKSLFEAINSPNAKLFYNIVNTKYKDPYCEYCYYLD